MKLLSGAMLTFVVLAFVACAPPPAEEVVVEEPDTTEADLAAVQALVEAWSTSFDLQNPESYLDLLSEDAKFLPQGAPILEGKEAIGAWIAEHFLDGTMTVSSEEREVMGAFAYDLGTFGLSPIPQEGEQPRTIYGKYVLIMRRQADGSWKLARYIWNFTPPPEE